MAQRRMFSPQILSSDAFLDMPPTAQILYVHFAMNADDDGFVGSPKKIMRMTGIGDDDFKILIAKRFLLTFDSGVVVIKHWKIHNLIRADRYRETQYLDEKSALITKENGAYTEWQPNGNQMETQVRLGKVRLGKDKKLSGDSVLSRGNDYNPDHNPPKRKKIILTDKQKANIKRMRCLDYFHQQGVAQGYDYLLKEDDQANRKFLGLARAFEKRYPDNWKEVVDWWFVGDNAWCDYHPSNFFTINTYLKYDNKHNKSNIIDL